MGAGDIVSHYTGSLRDQRAEGLASGPNYSVDDRLEELVNPIGASSWQYYKILLAVFLPVGRFHEVRMSPQARRARICAERSR